MATQAELPANQAHPCQHRTRTELDVAGRFWDLKHSEAIGFFGIWGTPIISHFEPQQSLFLNTCLYTFHD